VRSAVLFDALARLKAAGVPMIAATSVLITNDAATAHH
jgi:hypothetical protein